MSGSSSATSSTWRAPLHKRVSPDTTPSVPRAAAPTQIQGALQQGGESVKRRRTRLSICLSSLQWKLQIGKKPIWHSAVFFP